MRVLLIGGGGREHALAWKLKHDDTSLELLAAPGNPGIETLASCYPIAATDLPALLALAQDKGADLTVVGPEAPLASGIVDEFARHHLRIYGPSAAAARIEASKHYAKKLMLDAGIPTARASWHRDAVAAKRAARELGAPVVIKASGLAAGKGVAVCESLGDADAAIDSMLLRRSHGSAGDVVLVEEFMPGEELSIFAVSDGENFRTMLPAQDHKRLLEGDSGPNTGGMGAYAPVSVATTNVVLEVEESIIRPVLSALSEHDTPFQGTLYCGIMLTAYGPKVVEFNCRFGDPETEAVLPLMRSKLLDFMLRSTEVAGLSDAPEIEFSTDAAVTTVVAAPGYPDAPKLGGVIELSPPMDDVLVFHAGTRRAPDGDIVTAGGRVFAVTAVADSIDEAQRRSVAGAEHVRFAGRHFRRDIGWRELRRRAGVA